MKIRCIAIDDEPFALKQVCNYVEKTPFLNLVSTFNSALKAVEFVSNNRIDLLFLDIQMPDLSGIEFAKILNNNSKVIFTTAYQQFALEGFKVDAIDYLLKPFSYEEFLTASNKALKYFELLEKAEKKIETSDNYLFVKAEYKIRKINFNEILYIEGLKDYVRIYIENEKPVMSLISMKLLDEKLPASKFMRIHRSYIVNVEKIKIIERSRIVFGDKYLPVSDGYKDEFQKYVNSKFV
jgi:DNA-binding LytR/AlgR family response regulator